MLQDFTKAPRLAACPAEQGCTTRGLIGNGVTDNYTHTFTADERNAAEMLGEPFGTGRPEIDKGKVITPDVFFMIARTMPSTSRPA
jgi:hypothetical protein